MREPDVVPRRGLPADGVCATALDTTVEGVSSTWHSVLRSGFHAGPLHRHASDRHRGQKTRWRHALRD